MAIRKAFQSLQQRARAQNQLIAAFALITLLAILASRYLDSTIQEFSLSLFHLLSFIAFTAFTLFCASIFSRAGLSYVKKNGAQLEAENRLLLTKLISAGSYIAAFIVILWRLGVRADNIALVIGFIATGFALSIRDTIASYIAWFVLLRKRPFRIGDTIRIDGMEGRVIHIGTFFVVVDETPLNSKDYMRIPTTQFLQKPIMNFTNGKISGIILAKIKEGHTTPETILKNVTGVLQERQLTNAHAQLTFEGGEPHIKIAYEYDLEEKFELRTTLETLLIKEMKLSKRKNI